jgi:chromosome segregation ATPase
MTALCRFFCDKFKTDYSLFEIDNQKLRKILESSNFSHGKWRKDTERKIQNLNGQIKRLTEANQRLEQTLQNIEQSPPSTTKDLDLNHRQSLKEAVIVATSGLERDKRNLLSEIQELTNDTTALRELVRQHETHISTLGDIISQHKEDMIDSEMMERETTTQDHQANIIIDTNTARIQDLEAVLHANEVEILHLRHQLDVLARAKNHKIGNLKTSNRGKDYRIGNLQNENNTRQARIAELLNENNTRQARIEQLKIDKETRQKRVQELEKENSDMTLHIETLVGRVADLENLDKKHQAERENILAQPFIENKHPRKQPEHQGKRRRKREKGGHLEPERDAASPSSYR